VSERQPDGTEYSDLELEHRFLIEHNPEDHEAYFRTKVESVAAGQPTWVVRNFSDEKGRVYDFYRNDLIVGFITHDYSDGIYEAYIYDYVTPDEKSEYTGESLPEAVRRVESNNIELV